MYLYLNFDAERGGAKSSHDMWALLGATEAGFVIFFTIFVGAMAAKYRVTFFSTVTGKRFSQNKFRNATTDQVKCDIFSDHESFHVAIREEVDAWVRENYSSWTEEKPSWFTERVRKSIPKDMIPNDEQMSDVKGGVIRE